jgi:hypothetical protein
MNPLKWKWQHLVTWAALIIAGALVGMLFAWLVSPFSHLQVQGADRHTMFAAFLHYPWTYWPYIAAGAVAAGLAYYSADLLTGAR